MSKSDPITLSCCFCGKECKFADQGDALAFWKVEYNSKEEPVAICNEHALYAEAQEMMAAILAGKPIPKKGDIELKEEVKVETKGVKIRARFSLVSVDVEVGGKAITGLPDLVVADLLKSLDALEIGKEYSITLK